MELGADCVLGPQSWDLLFWKLALGFDLERLSFDGFHHPLNMPACHICPPLVRAQQTHRDFPFRQPLIPYFDAARDAGLFLSTLPDGVYFVVH